MKVATGGFESILNRVSSTYKIENVIPRNTTLGSTISINNKENSENDLQGKLRSIANSKSDLVPAINNETIIPANLRRLSLSGRQESFNRTEVTSSANSPFNILGTISVDDEVEASEMTPSMIPITTTTSEESKPNKENVNNNKHSKEAEGSSKMLLKFSTWNKGSASQEGDSDEDSTASNESYDQKKELKNTPLMPFTEELMKHKPNIKDSVDLMKGIVVSVVEPNQQPLIAFSPQTTDSSAPQTINLTTPSPASTSLLVPGSDIVHVRRASFSTLVFKPSIIPPQPTPTIENTNSKNLSVKASLQPSSTFHSSITPTFSLTTEEKSSRRKSAVTFGENQVKTFTSGPPVITIDDSNQSQEQQNSNEELAYPSPEPLSAPKRNSLQVPNQQHASEVEQTVSAWKKLKKESKSSLSVQPSQNETASRFTNFSEIVTVMKDLKNLGMDSSLVVRFIFLRLFLYIRHTYELFLTLFI
jgi:hypothetical protein